MEKDKNCKCSIKVKSQYNTIVEIGGKKINLRNADHNQMYAIAPWLYEKKVCTACKTKMN